MINISFVHRHTRHYPTKARTRASRGTWVLCVATAAHAWCYLGVMAREAIVGGVVHEVPDDLREALSSDSEALAAWESLTPLARNEWICWTISVKKPETRKEHVERVPAELKDGVRRPCCWIGCIHRTDKPISPSVRHVLGRKSKSRQR